MRAHALLLVVTLCWTTVIQGSRKEQIMSTPAKLSHPRIILMVAAAAASMLIAGVCYADPFFFSTGNPDGKIATAARPESPGKFEIESADDFVLVNHTRLTQTTFVGLLTSTGPAVPTIAQLVVEIYRVFPADSNVGRTSGPP